MSILPVPVQRKVSDNQFIGDLMSLFERRKIKCGDAASLDNFAVELGANDAFRSQLFTLCTAISHMAAQDLSGAQLLELVARALGGPGLPKRGGAVEVPEAMRTAFLRGYEAWCNRGMEPREPLPWPAPGEAAPRENTAAPTTADGAASTADKAAGVAGAEPAAARPAGAGLHTLQEALDIAKERRLADRDSEAGAAAAPGAGAQGTAGHGLAANLEELTISELKALLGEIEQRVHRIEPRLQKLTGAGRTAADELGLRERIREMEAGHPPEAAGAAGAAGADAQRGQPPSSIDEAAFLARHAYLRPRRRLVLEATTADAAGAGLPVAKSAMPAAGVGPDESAAGSAATVFPATVAQAAAVATPAPVEIIPAAAAAGPAPIPYRVPAERFDDEGTRLRVSPRGMAVGLGAGVLFLLVVSGLAGVLVYPSLHPKTMDDFPELKAAAAEGTPAPAAGYVAGGPQLILSAQADPEGDDSRAQAARAVAAQPRVAAARPQAVAQPAGVWPYVPRTAVRDAAPAASGGNTTAATRDNLASMPPVPVASTTLMGYALAAPQPAYPADEPRGISGTVVVQVTVSKEGKVTGIRAVSGPEELRPATVRAVEQWRFRPYLINGAPADVVTTLGFLFQGR